MRDKTLLDCDWSIHVRITAAAFRDECYRSRQTIRIWQSISFNASNLKDQLEFEGFKDMRAAWLRRGVRPDAGTLSSVVLQIHAFRTVSKHPSILPKLEVSD
ncbi:hypothetical protein Y032_0396g682 [Ancylostoma ceylanicum]|uniref:Uncharacterized protein n=1 Tax=Ancylostoma ceylanicum TaxID=53326 RepID=A0A016RS77_9BILA|nr:hypothetical protein Y032_0396g682 [Ancylostoma ceylanicum]